MFLIPTPVAAEAKRIADEVAISLGEPEPFRQAYVAISETAIKETAARYAELPRLSTDALPAWDAMAAEVNVQFAALERAGFDLQVCEENPYDRVLDLFTAVAERRELHVPSTAATGGHPVWSDEQNDRFRAVHDLFGHCRTARGFNSHGEEAAHRSHRTMFSELATLAMVTETRGQNHAMMAVGTGQFAAERIAILPAHVRELKYGDVQYNTPDLERLAAAKAYDIKIGIAQELPARPAYTARPGFAFRP